MLLTIEDPAFNDEFEEGGIEDSDRMLLAIDGPGTDGEPVKTGVSRVVVTLMTLEEKIIAVCDRMLPSIEVPGEECDAVSCLEEAESTSSELETGRSTTVAADVELEAISDAKWETLANIALSSDATD